MISMMTKDDCALYELTSEIVGNVWMLDFFSLFIFYSIVSYWVQHLYPSVILLSSNKYIKYLLINKNILYLKYDLNQNLKSLVKIKVKVINQSQMII